MRLGTPVAVSGLDAEHAAERRVLEQALCAHSTRWAEWIATLSEAQLNGTLCYANMSGAGFEQPLAALLLHVFNHGTHHRGQISAATTACGLEAPGMDLIWYLQRP